MLRGSGITKSNKKKWNVTPGMEPKKLISNQVGASSSRMDVKNTVHFVINSDYKLTSPLMDKKSIELTRKTYPKKSPLLIHPFMSSDPLEPFRDSLSAKDRLPSSLMLKCTPVTQDSKMPFKKPKSEPGSSNGSRTILPKRTQKRKLAQSCDATVPKQPKSRSLGSCPKVEDASSDSDIEIVGVYKKSSGVGTNSRPSVLTKMTNGQSNGQLSIKKSLKSFEPKANGHEVVINEADIAPFMPANPTAFPEANSSANSMRWLAANGEISISKIEPNSIVKKEATQAKSADAGKIPLSLNKVKSEDTKKKGARELKILHDQLNEISWAQKNSFKKLLLNPEKRVGKTGKNLRSLKPTQKLEEVNTKRAAKVKASQLMAIKKKKLASLKLKNKLVQKNKATEDMKKKRPVKQTANGTDTKKVPGRPKGISVAKNSKSSTNEETEILYSLPNPVEIPGTKPKMGVPKVKSTATACEVKNNGSKVKGQVQKVKSSVTKLKCEAPKTKSNFLQLKPDSLKQKSNIFKLKPDELQKSKSLLKLKPDKPVGKSYYTMPEDSPPSTSGTQENTFSSKSTSKNCNKASNSKNFLKNVENFEFSRQILKNFLNDSENLYSNVRKASELHVLLQPLEHTNFWKSEFYDEIRRHFLDQALRRALESKDRESMGVMYQDLLESYVNVQAVDNVVSNNNGNRTTKKKRLGEEEALRTSVRQSEGAFRNKEIVVKKHQNYMQVVLVPNEAKQNSLTIEAMKEMKEAFLLAKKDPNCNAVLLNSSGKYFCTGLDLTPLVGSNKKQAAEELSTAVRDLVLTLGMFTKPVVAAVNGATVGFGVSILTYCDVVLASDKATFCFPATKIGYIPEGGVTLTLPQVVGSNVASEMFLQGRRLTAEQALRHGLVSEVLWPTKLMNEVIPRLQTIISQPLTAMETTKAMVRYHLWDKLKSHLERERRLIVEHWVGATCQNNIKALLQTGWVDD